MDILVSSNCLMQRKKENVSEREKERTSIYYSWSVDLEFLSSELDLSRAHMLCRKERGMSRGPRPMQIGPFDRARSLIPKQRPVELFRLIRTNPQHLLVNKQIIPRTRILIENHP